MNVYTYAELYPVTHEQYVIASEDRDTAAAQLACYLDEVEMKDVAVKPEYMVELYTSGPGIRILKSPFGASD